MARGSRITQKRDGWISQKVTGLVNLHMLSSGRWELGFTAAKERQQHETPCCVNDELPYRQ